MKIRKQKLEMRKHLPEIRIISFLLSCFLFLILCIFLPSCGYHIAGKGGGMPGNVATISIPFFENRVQKPDVETILTTAVVDEFAKSNIVRVVSEGGEAVLKGIVSGYALTPVSFNQNDVIQEYRLTITLDIELVRTSDSTILWRNKGFIDYEDFKITAVDVDATKTAELEALRKMAKDIARLIKERMIEDF